MTKPTSGKKMTISSLTNLTAIAKLGYIASYGYNLNTKVDLAYTIIYLSMLIMDVYVKNSLNYNARMSIKISCTILCTLVIALSFVISLK